MRLYGWKIGVRRSHSEIVLSAYCISVLIFLTFSQKIINVALHRPYLYVGVALIALHIVYHFSRLLIEGEILFPRILILVLFILCVQFITALPSERAVKDFLIANTTQLAFAVSFAAYARLMDFDLLIKRIAEALIIFALFEAIVAWLLYFGMSIPFGDCVYSHQPTWGVRLHGVAAEPTHLGTIMGIGLLSCFFVYGKSNEKISFRGFVIFAFLLGTLLMSGARSVILSLIPGAIISIVFYKRTRFPWYVYSLLGIAGFLFFFLGPIDEIVFFIEGTLRIGDTGSENIRMIKYTNGVLLFFDSGFHNLIFGRGFSFVRLNYSFMNQYLEILIGFGFLGFFCFTYILSVATVNYKRLLRIRRDTAVYGFALLLFSIIFFLMSAPLFGVFHVSTFIFYVSLFIAFSRYGRIVKVPKYGKSIELV